MTKSKTYTNRSNCVRAAKAALGKSAKPGVEFTLTSEGQDAWTFTPTSASGLPAAEPEKHDVDAKPVVAPKAKRTRSPKGEKASIVNQPAMQKVIGLMQRKTGVTVIEGAERTESNIHTFRGKVSLLKTARVPFTTVRTGRIITYFLDPEWAA